MPSKYINNILILLIILPVVYSYSYPSDQMSEIQEQYQKQYQDKYQKQMEETQKKISEQVEKSIQEQINKNIEEQVNRQSEAVQMQVQNQVEAQANLTKAVVTESIAASTKDSKQPILWLIILIALITIIVIAYKSFVYYSKKKSEKAFATVRGELAVIMFTDMKSFSKHVGKHEQETLKQVWEYEQIMRNIIKKNGGTVIKTIGDSVMATFKSAIHAVDCAKSIQNELKGKSLKIRIGLHLGEVTHKEGDVYGNNVNIAARIESKASPGGVAVSEDIYKQVHGKVQHKFKFIGDVELKNIKEPVKLYKVL